MLRQIKNGIGHAEGQSDSPSLIIISLITIPWKKYYTTLRRYNFNHRQHLLFTMR